MTILQKLVDVSSLLPGTIVEMRALIEENAELK